jgi:hypothetical protein
LGTGEPPGKRVFLTLAVVGQMTMGYRSMAWKVKSMQAAEKRNGSYRKKMRWNEIAIGKQIIQDSGQAPIVFLTFGPYVAIGGHR